MSTTRACALAAAVLFSLVVGVPGATAQSDPLQPGDTVRVTRDGVRMTGRVVRQGPATLVIRTNGEEREIALGSGVFLERGTRRTRQQQMRQNEVIGGVSGALAGAIIGLVSGDDENCWLCFTAPEKALAGSLFFGASGAAAGALIGAFQKPGTAWRTVHSAPAVRVGTAGGGVGLGLEWSF